MLKNVWFKMMELSNIDLGNIDQSFSLWKKLLIFIHNVYVVAICGRNPYAIVGIPIFIIFVILSYRFTKDKATKKIIKGILIQMLGWLAGLGAFLIMMLLFWLVPKILLR